MKINYIIALVALSVAAVGCSKSKGTSCNPNVIQFYEDTETYKFHGSLKNGVIIVN